MVFSYLGRSVQRTWYLWLTGWVLLLLASWYFAPSWDVVAQDREFAFLPKDAPSIEAEQVFKEAFPNDHLASSIVLVLSRSEDPPGHLDRDKKFIEDVVEPGLRAIASSEGGLADQPVTDTSNADPFATPATPAPAVSQKRSIMAQIHTPNAPVIGDLLVSPDHKALLVVVELTTEFLSRDNWPTIERIEDLTRQLRQDGKLPPGVDLAVTGSAVIGRDHTQAELQSVRSTTTLTVILVVFLLVLIYRAPLLALIPLGTVYLSVQLALNVLAILSQSGYLTLFQGLQIYITILAYGAGIDYCLFLTARYREELDRGTPPAEGVAKAIGGVGAALTASAATVICGIAMMAFARFGKFHEAGLAIPLGLFLVLCATLTFSPALLRLVGPWAFWPQRVKKTAAGAATGSAPRSSFILGELGLAWERVGEHLQRRPGMIWLVTVACMVPFAIFAGVNYARLSYDTVGDLPSSAPSVAGTQALQEHFPPGIMGTSTVVLINKHLDFSKPQGRAVVQQITDRLRAQRDQLGLSDVRSLTAPLGITAQANVHEHQQAIKEQANLHYLGYLGEESEIVVTRLDIVLADSPFSRRGFEDLDRIEQAIREAMPADVRANTTLAVVGTTASVRDLARVMKQDRLRIEGLVLGSVFLILILLLRKFIVTVYLLLSVLFSYYVTLGVTIALFWMLDPHGFTGIDWKVAIFLFTILIAVGEDYNIFLMTRIHEEDRRHGPQQAITHALTRTGPIISSCGIIMAGTFGSLLAGSLTEMKQLGFALAFGVLLDTFLVRPVLVPSFLLLLRSGRLSPMQWFRKGPAIKAVSPQPGVRAQETQTAS